MEGERRVGVTSGNRSNASSSGGSSKGGRVGRTPSAGRRLRADDGGREPIDLETASAAEIERLPRVGPALARRIVEDRAAHGPFRSLEGLQRVRGVGPAVARQLQGHVTFGGTGRP
jgi:competence ComEA-like helix-hairpin-helix protein